MEQVSWIFILALATFALTFIALIYSWARTKRDAQVGKRSKLANIDEDRLK